LAGPDRTVDVLLAHKRGIGRAIDRGARSLPGKALRVIAAAVRAFRRTGRFTLDIAIDGHRRHIDSVAVLVTVNRFSGEQWRRARLDEGMLEVHIVENTGALGKLKAGADMLTGAWRNNPGIQSIMAQRVTVYSGRSRAWVSTDGELLRERMPLTYEIRPRFLTVLIPSRSVKQ
jgi:diacylglycerol kinase family enzyme